jgi:prophage tail gpP-like protein
MGADGQETDVFSGLVNGVARQISGVTVEALAATSPLSRSFAAQAYQDQNVGEIINDLAGRAGVATGTIDGAMAVKIWHVTEQHSAWWHIHRLAKMGGYEVLCDPAGALTVRPVGSAGETHTLGYGAQILEMEAETFSDPGIFREYAPAGAGSELGSDKWQITLRQPAGDGQGQVAVVGTLRDRDTADEMTRAVMGATARELFRGRVVITPDAAIRPGDTVELTDLPGGKTLDARVTGVHHSFDNRSGFLTTLALGGMP